MNKRLKELAEQAGFTSWTDCFNKYHLFYYEDEITEELERFAELVRQDEREQISHTYLKLTLDAVLREREICAKLCRDKLMQTPYGEVVSAAIRARSNHD